MLKNILTLIALLLFNVQMALAQNISNDDIKETLDFNAGTAAYTLSTDLPAGSTLTWSIDGKNIAARRHAAQRLR